MSFETLSERHEFAINPFPSEWLPLLYLYDPDLPLFPLLYFHELDPLIPAGTRPGRSDRIFGYVHHVNLDNDTLRVSLALNKNLALPQNSHLIQVAEKAARERLGIESPVVLADIENALEERLADSNAVLKELWYQVVDGSFGRSLPFGKMWDPVLGLARFVASWNSDGGRKGELIQTHSFVRDFGVAVPTGGGFHADFFLLPTWAELRDVSNPLNLFDRYRNLLNAADDFVARYCDPVSAGTFTFSAFRLKAKTGLTGSLDTQKIVDLMNRADRYTEELFNNYSAFNRGPHRSVLSLMMLHDLRSGHWSPEAFTGAECAELYKNLDSTYQSPKVVQLYAQQCFGADTALPIDIWVETFLRWPLNFSPTAKKLWHAELFQACAKWGRVERLIWLASQARKVHSSVCAEILWCIRFGGPDKQMRGANPLACKLCAVNIRNACPAFASAKTRTVRFNQVPGSGEFAIWTENPKGDQANRRIVSCESVGLADEYSVRDRPDAFRSFPVHGHDGGPITVEQFVRLY
jgi:hypothetical protein